MPKTISEIELELNTKKKELENVRGSETEVFARIVGYYRPVSKWNTGKKQEFQDRVTFKLN